ncbi:MAG: helix-turn-helix domain-containing protein [Bacteroides sp.]|nr:helix-turn-helix domain-containing protein [Prevotella sp.]MCM1407532.1 helix-turn-helix domain-containing protein [Treponema brennaborense]MCM1470022.1 helix-turn-helix domain-containing protein [Bacteroides sp.]
MDKSEVFVKRLRELVFQSRYTQKQIAQLCHITEASFSRYMNGERIPKPEILANLATALHTTTDYLLGNEDPYSDYAELRALVARSNRYLTKEQRGELAGILLGITERLEQEEKR